MIFRSSAAPAVSASPWWKSCFAGGTGGHRHQGACACPLFVITRRILRPEVQAGWSSAHSAIMIVDGIIMSLLGLIGEYVGRIYICLNKSPWFVVKEIVGSGEEASWLIGK